MTSPDSPSDGPGDTEFAKTEPGEADAGAGTERAARAALGTDDPGGLQTDLEGGGDTLDDAGLEGGRDEADKS